MTWVVDTRSSILTQLGQVEAALSADPENDELLSLKNDLVEIIQITDDLVEQDKRKVSWKCYDDFTIII